ncbi:hypothetical protein EVC45_17570 [Paraburkholderia sp. UYCP14C]|uniref:hypothetical protein n=1 Tax=Paraburkholderia sp. UYCP14C TaxID=2511130 RepID=UPI0010201495|nr:hypothetical protein [Paraburkholderia sp. UYCP14C]RZF28389.1 hypothetical protein EVC45_17570 [Paraburkholderia sp. UYCP14C]
MRWQTVGKTTRKTADEIALKIAAEKIIAKACRFSVASAVVVVERAASASERPSSTRFSDDFSQGDDR